MQEFPLDLQPGPLESHYEKNKNFRHHLFGERYGEQKVLNPSVNGAGRGGCHVWAQGLAFCAHA